MHVVAISILIHFVGFQREVLHLYAQCINIYQGILERKSFFEARNVSLKVGNAVKVKLDLLCLLLCCRVSKFYHQAKRDCLVQISC